MFTLTTGDSLHLSVAGHELTWHATRACIVGNPVDILEVTQLAAAGVLVAVPTPPPIGVWHRRWLRARWRVLVLIGWKHL